MQFYLIEKSGEYRLTGFVSETHAKNHVRHGWEIVKAWKTEPTGTAVKETAFIHSERNAS